MQGREGVLSLAQGIVSWQPPPQALEAVLRVVLHPSTSLYCQDEGLPELRGRLWAKLRDQGLVSSEVMVTSGANQGYTNVVLTLLDPGQAALLYRPYYFNHLMALQMTGSSQELLLPPFLPDMQPDSEFLKAEFLKRTDHGSGLPPLKMVTLVNPGNPTGTMLTLASLNQVSELCAQYGAWLVIDNTYEAFAYEGEEPHACIEGPHIVNIFSFSKGHGMMGWRVGYLAYPPALSSQLLKCQDTITICPPIASQHCALGALDAGHDWVMEQVRHLAPQKALVLDSLSPLGPGAVKGGSGAIYFLCQLPEGVDDLKMVEWLTREHRVAVIPGSACGWPGHIRVCYANLPPEQTKEAARRLQEGLREMLSGLSLE